MDFRTLFNLLMLLSTTLFSANAVADEQLDDLAGRIEYAFYAADSRNLQQAVQSMAKLDIDSGQGEQRNIYLNYGRWKLAQLLAKQNSSDAAQPAADCADVTTAEKTGALLALHQALHAACLGMLEQLRPLRSTLYHAGLDAALSKAQQFGAKLAEVQFVSVWLAASKSHGKDYPDQRYAELTRAVASYAAAEAEPHAGVPRWGYAEACYLLGKAELARGNLLAARNTLERALVLAPDYRDAQQALHSLNVK